MDRLARLKEQSELLDRTLAQLDKEVSAHNKLKQAVIGASVFGNGGCWCRDLSIENHTGRCERVYVALYGKER